MHVRRVLYRLREASLQVNIKKCEFNITCTKYLGFIVTIDEVEVDPKKVSIVNKQ